MTYSYKQLTGSDAMLLKQLLKVFAKAFGEPQTYQSAVPSDAYLRSLLEKPHFIVVVAMNGSKVIGGLAAYELEKFEQDRREIYIYDLAVSQDHRRQGVASQLLNKLKLVAKERKAYLIFVQADPGDDPAIRHMNHLEKKRMSIILTFQWTAIELGAG